MDPKAGLDDVNKKILGPTETRTPSPQSSIPQPVAIPTAFSRLIKHTYALEHCESMDGHYASHLKVEGYS
jgi:hypothetical protein